jgi:hypothetical protein
VLVRLDPHKYPEPIRWSVDFTCTRKILSPDSTRTSKDDESPRGFDTLNRIRTAFALNTAQRGWWQAFCKPVGEFCDQVVDSCRDRVRRLGIFIDKSALTHNLTTLTVPCNLRTQTSVGGSNSAISSSEGRSKRSLHFTISSRVIGGDSRFRRRILSNKTSTGASMK